MSNPHQQPPQFQPQPSGNRSQRNLIVALVGASVVLIIILAIMVAVAASGGSDTEAASTNTSANSDSSEKLGPPVPGDTDPASACVSSSSNRVAASRWTTDMRTAPEYTLLLTEQYALPGQLATLTDPELSAQGGVAAFSESRMWFGITQFQDKSVGVVDTLDGDDQAQLAVLDPNTGQVIGQYSADSPAGAPAPFDLAEKMTASAYHSVVPADGVEIPAVAAGTSDGMHYVIGVMPDAFDDTQVWVLMRGAAALYRAELHKTADSYTPCGAE